MTTAQQAQVSLWQDRIIKDPLILGGKPIVKWTRLSVEFITSELERGSHRSRSPLRLLSASDRESGGYKMIWQNGN